jgi:hypothetical protein
MDRKYKQHFHTTTPEASSSALSASGYAHAGLLPAAQRAVVARRSSHRKA